MVRSEMTLSFSVDGFEAALLSALYEYLKLEDGDLYEDISPQGVESYLLIWDVLIEHAKGILHAQEGMSEDAGQHLRERLARYGITYED